MCRRSLVHPPPIRRLRDLTRYRRALVSDRSREMQRVEKLLEDAQIKISSVLSDIHGVSGRAMMEALIAGQRDPWSLARLAKGIARKKIDRLDLAQRARTVWQYQHGSPSRGRLPPITVVPSDRLPRRFIRPLRRPNRDGLSPPLDTPGASWRTVRPRKKPTLSSKSHWPSAIRRPHA